MNMKTRADILDRLPRRSSDVFLAWESILVLLLIGTVIMGSLLSEYFLDIWTLSDATFNFSEKAIIALPMALLILVREIDLSVAAIIAVASLAMGLCVELGLGPYQLALVGITTGLICGMFNGFLVTQIGLPSIVVTIGTMSLFRGIAQVVLGDQAFTTYPKGFNTLGRGYALKMPEMPPIPFSFATFLVLAVIFAIVLHMTGFGRKMFAMGNNPVAARFSGVPVNRIKFTLFAVTGLLAGLAAVFLTSRIGSTRPNIALGWELEIITMVILGGISIAGGSGSIVGVVLAAFIIGLATLALSLINVPGIVVSVLLGLLLITSIAAPIIIRRVMGLRA
jgi:rhamnose transport system permease protein